MVDRISSFTQTQQLLENNLRTQKAYAETQVQISTGQKSDTYQGIAKDTNRILNLESDYQRLVTQSENAQIALDRNNAGFDALGGVIELAQSFTADVQSGLTGVGISSAQLQEIAELSLTQTAADLNTQVGGRYIFSGSATGTAPVDINAAGFGGATIPSAADTSYYQGNSFIQSVEAADGLTVDYGVTADDTGIEQIIRAYDLVRTTPGDPNTLQEALVLLQSGLDALATTKANIGQDSQALDRAINDNLEEINLVDNIITDLKAVDLAEASVKLQELSAQLEASYAITVDLLQLNLSDFLR